MTTIEEYKWWLDTMIDENNIPFDNIQDKEKFKAYYLYHCLKKREIPIADVEYRLEFERISYFIEAKMMNKWYGGEYDAYRIEELLKE